MAAKNGSAAALIRLLKQELLRYKIAQMLLYCAAAFHAQVVARNNDSRALPAVVCALARARAGAVPCSFCSSSPSSCSSCPPCASLSSCTPSSLIALPRCPCACADLVSPVQANTRQRGEEERTPSRRRAAGSVHEQKCALTCLTCLFPSLSSRLRRRPTSSLCKLSRPICGLGTIQR